MASKEKPESLGLTPKSDVKSEEKLEFTPASEIKKLKEERDAGKIMKLPSGIVISVKKPDISIMIIDGDIPSDLMAIALGKEKIDELTPAGMKKGLEMMNLMVKSSLVSPKVVDKDPKENEILITDLSETDKSFIVGDAQSEVGNLKSFRSDKGKNDDSGHPNKEVSESKTK